MHKYTLSLPFHAPSPCGTQSAGAAPKRELVESVLRISCIWKKKHVDTKVRLR